MLNTAISRAPFKVDDPQKIPAGRYYDERRGLGLEALGSTKEMAGHENDPHVERINPELTEGAYIGPSRGHLFSKYGRNTDMPRPYNYGASMGGWVTDCLSGWTGRHGTVAHSIANYRGPALSSDFAIQTADVVAKTIDEQSRHLVHVKHLMANQKGVTPCTGTAEIQLPKRA